MQKILGFFKSLKLAAWLIAVLAVGSALATAIPQGLDAESYAAAYGKLLGGLVFRSGLADFFVSPLFLAPSFLFFANLSACTMDRLVRELKKKERRRHGPDILHVGLMLLVVGGILSFSGRAEGAASLAAGESAILPDGRTLRLDRLERRTYEDGRPRDWISTVSVLREGRTEIEGYPLRVNHPLRLGRLTLYQASYAQEGEIERSGIKAVTDPGYYLVLAALLVAGGGIFLTFAQKLGDLKR